MLYICKIFMCDLTSRFELARQVSWLGICYACSGDRADELPTSDFLFASVMSDER